MMSITAANTKNLPTTVAVGPKTYDKKDRAIAAAVREIGEHARNGFEFEVSKCDGRWIWKPTDGTKPLSAAHIKAEGGKKALLIPIGQTVSTAALNAASVGNTVDAAKSAELRKATMDKLATNLQGTPAADLATSIAAVAAIDVTENANGVPAFLARSPDTEEAKQQRIDQMKKTVGPGRKIKDPPNIKRGEGGTKGPSGPASQARADGLKAGSSGAILVDTVCRKGGATNEELCKAVGWAQCLPAMKKYAAKAGVTITTKKEKGQPTRYIGTR